MLNFSNLSMVMGDKLLFHEVELLIKQQGRYGLVGANGCGKSTLFKLICSQLEPSDGEVIIPNDSRIGWLNQDHFRFDKEIIVNVVIRGNTILWDALEQKNKLLGKEDFSEEDAEILGELENIIHQHDGYQAESRAEELLIGLGINPAQIYDELNVLSGGYKMRVLLAQTLFNNPDILLLDEPTNHLDIITISWLEKYLINNYRGILFVISHDRGFLDKLVTHIIDIDYGDIRLYHGNYAKFMQDKQQAVDLITKERENTGKKIAQMQAFVDKFKAKATKAKQAQSRVKMIAKIKMPEREVSSRHAPYINFKVTNPSNKQVLQVEDLSMEFAECKLYQNVNFTILRGDRVGIIGHNGVGKSTLLKQVLGEYPDAGTNYHWGERATIAYFSQDHKDLLKSSMTVLDWLNNESSASTDMVRRVLGQMLFRAKDIDKDVLSLSGGEAARLLIAKMILKQANVLIFDEPTNHLDLESIDALAEALQAFTGTIIFVSHNEYFVGKLATRILAMTTNKVDDYMGTYKEFVQKSGADYFSSQWLKNN